MKSVLNSGLILMTLIFGLFTTTQIAMAADNTVVTLDVPGMNCKFCPITIRKALNKVPGVIEAKSDFETKTATVKFDPDKTNIEELTKATADAGYPSTIKK